MYIKNIGLKGSENSLQYQRFLLTTKINLMPTYRFEIRAALIDNNNGKQELKM